MARYTNNSGGNLVFPDGTEVRHGAQTPDLDAYDKNVAVKEWHAIGWLSDPAGEVPAEDVAAKKAAADKAGTEAAAGKK